MTVKVLFFGATAAITGRRLVEVELPVGSKALTILDKLVAEYPRLAVHDLRFSVNQLFATGDESVFDGDEVAVFTQFSGG